MKNRRNAGNRAVMTRALIGVLASTFLMGLLSYGGDADAQRRRRRAAPAAEVTPQSDAIAGALGPIEWGWTRRQLVDHFSRALRAEYQPQIHKARDAMTADRYRHELNQKVQRIRESVIQFNGRTTGYDSGFLRDEFTHRNNESMVRVRSENADDYYFFINDRLWKWYRAFDASVFEGADFAQFSTALQGRFGEGRTRSGAQTEGGQEKQWVEWQDANTRLRALDNTTFYGFYCLVFEEKATLENLASLRTNKQQRGRGSHALVDAVTSGERAENPDSNADVVDRITGNIRRRNNAPEDSSMGSSMGSSMDAPPRRDGTGIDDDPLNGLD